MNSFTTPQMVEWFAGLPGWLAFAVKGERCTLSADRRPDEHGAVAIRFADGIRRVPLPTVRYWPLWQDWPGTKLRG